ncbi:hypothetical protein CsSME_00030313 [Camellia sinensis var. sinensis]
MAKTVPRIGSCRNGHIGSHKNTRRISKGFIHVQASFNNTIVTVRDIRGRGYKKRDVFCYSNRSGKCYSCSSGSRYAMSRGYDKRSRSQKRRKYIYEVVPTY